MSCSAVGAFGVGSTGTTSTGAADVLGSTAGAFGLRLGSTGASSSGDPADVVGSAAGAFGLGLGSTGVLSAVRSTAGGSGSAAGAFGLGIGSTGALSTAGSAAGELGSAAGPSGPTRTPGHLKKTMLIFLMANIQTFFSNSYQVTGCGIDTHRLCELTSACL